MIVPKSEQALKVNDIKSQDKVESFDDMMDAIKEQEVE